MTKSLARPLLYPLLLHWLHPFISLFRCELFHYESVTYRELQLNEWTIVDPIGAVESVKAASDIYAPVSGVVEEINETLSNQPGLLNKQPQGDGKSKPITYFWSRLHYIHIYRIRRCIDVWSVLGWLCKMRLTIPSEFDTLLNDTAYKAHCEGEEAADDKSWSKGKFWDMSLRWKGEISGLICWPCGSNLVQTWLDIWKLYSDTSSFQRQLPLAFTHGGLRLSQSWWTQIIWAFCLIGKLTTQRWRPVESL